MVEAKGSACTNSRRSWPLGSKKELGKSCPVSGGCLVRVEPEQRGGANLCSVGRTGGGEGDGKATDEGSEVRHRHFACSGSDDGTGHGSGGCGNGSGVERASGSESHEDDADSGDDFSVSYALHYPNECADPALEEEDLTVGEHVDPSLFVAEPCCGVEGLEICDRASGR